MTVKMGWSDGYDTRVKRIKQEGGTYSYYLTKNEQNIGIEILSGDVVSEAPIENPVNNKSKTYEERDLHKLLSSYLKNSGIYSKTIFHEQSNGKDSNQIWTHPDMVGVNFLKLALKRLKIPSTTCPHRLCFACNKESSF